MHAPCRRLAVVAAVCAPLLVSSASADRLMDPRDEDGAAVRQLPPMQRLGRLLFHDTGLSDPPGQSCATCHDARAAFTDPDQRFPTSQGVDRRLFGKRNGPTAMYAAFSPVFHFDEAEQLFVGGQFLDGRAATLEEQAKGPFLNPLEMANTSRAQVVEKVRGAPYAPLFRNVFGPQSLDDPDAAYERIAQAIAAFERSPVLNRFTSKYDRYLAGEVMLTPQELRGLRAFEDERKGNCAACHPSRPAADGTPPLFTDFTYDNIGVPKNPHNRFYRMAAQFNPDGLKFVDKGLGETVNLASQDGRFKVPTLRNVALTAPYTHNGYFRSLRAVVEFYSTRDVKPRCAQEWVTEEQALQRACWPGPEEPANVNREELGNLGLTGQEVGDIVAFLQTLTDGWRPRQPQR
jgi:cytochrome c peroxidase